MKTITLTDGKKVEISDASYNAIEQAIGKAIAEVKQSGFVASNVWYSSDMKLYTIVYGESQLYKSNDGIVVNKKYLNGNKRCNWIETTRDKMCVGDIINLSSNRKEVDEYTPQLIVEITNGVLYTQYFNTYGRVVCDNRIVSTNTCFIART